MVDIEYVKNNVRPGWQLNPNEKIVCGILVHEFREDVNIAFVTKLGQIKRSSLKELEVNKYARPIKCFRLLDGDELVDVKPLNGNIVLKKEFKSSNITS